MTTKAENLYQSEREFFNSFSKENQARLLSDKIVTITKGEPNTISETIFEYGLSDDGRAIQSRHSGTSRGCFWTDWR